MEAASGASFHQWISASSGRFLAGAGRVWGKTGVASEDIISGSRNTDVTGV
jgi:hypothetical protein